MAAIAKPKHTPWRFAGIRLPDDKRAFFRVLGPIAQDVQIRTGIPASVTLSQAWRESRGSGGGLSELAKPPHHNIYGLKDGLCTRQFADGTYQAGTWEDLDGDGQRDPNEGTGARFATFPSYYAATLQHAALFYCASAYRQALAYRGNARAFLEMIGPIYATDASYSARVRQDVEHYDLQRWDVPPAEWALDADVVPELYVASWRNAVEVSA